jgi:prophage DNA circulation protein
VSYLDLKNALIDALDQDGPGVLRLPLPYNMADVTVMVQQYSISESRERGGVATVEMQFVEYGDPAYRPTISTAGNIEQSATALETSMLSTATGLPASQVFNSNSFTLAAPYYQVYSQASPPTTQPTLNQ